MSVSRRRRVAPRLAPLGAVLLFATALTAQEVWDNGPLIGAPFACLVNDMTRGLDPKQIHSKKAGFSATAARTTVPASGPDFRFDRIFRHPRTGTTVPSGLRIDALSTGLDVIQIDPATGIITPPTGSSMQGMLLSFLPENPMARTTRPGGVLRREDSNPDGAGTDVFDLVFGLPSFGTDLYRELDGTETGLSDGTTASRPGQITALDLPLTAWDLDAGIVSLLPRHPRIFFSVPATAVAAVPNAWWPLGDRNGATILYTEWDTAAAPGDWSEPQVFATRSQLLLESGEDVDALAVQWNSAATTTMVVFSTRAPTTRNQILFLELPFTDGDPQPVRTSTSTTATDAAGAGSADVASICLWDPGLFGQSPCAPQRWSYMLGWPDGNLPLPSSLAPRTLASSAIRACPGGPAAISCMMAGWTAAGRPMPPNAGAAVHLLTVAPYPSTSPLPPPAPTLPAFLNGPVFGRPMSLTGGDPLTSNLPLPGYLLGPDPARCFDFLWSYWVAVRVGPSGMEFAQSHPVRVRL